VSLAIKLAFVPAEKEFKGQLGWRVPHQKALRQRFRPVFGHQPPDKSRAARCVGQEVSQGVSLLVG
jgi:hypothetical protein